MTVVDVTVVDEVVIVLHEASGSVLRLWLALALRWLGSGKMPILSAVWRHL